MSRIREKATESEAVVRNITKEIQERMLACGVRVPRIFGRATVLNEPGHDRGLDERLDPRWECFEGDRGLGLLRRLSLSCL